MDDVENAKEEVVDVPDGEAVEDISVQRDSTPASVDNSAECKPLESVIDYAKNTMNSFLSMYGYEESMTTEALKSKIKSEPSSPSKEKSHTYSADVSSSHVPNIKIEEVKKDISTSSPRTATVMPIQSTSSKADRIENVGSSKVGIPHNGVSSKVPVAVPRKPITPYMRYRNMIFEEIKHKYPGCSPYDLACLISSKWSMLTDSERKVWEDQYEQEMREYSVNLKEYSETLKKIFKSTDPTSPAAVIKGVSSEENKTPVRQGSCNWCKKATVLLDFSSVLDGREIYCTGLCSEKCFTEAAKQIVSIENGNNKPRYVSGNRTQPQPREDLRVSTFAPVPQYSTVSSTEASSALFQPLFDWDQYLIETQSSAAPWLYFKQSRYPPPNNFVVGMKLEACNGQTIPGYSLATVVAVSGARILLHFDGSDASSDIWRLPDSGDIHPVGWTEASQLKPPTGYKYDYSKYRRFHASSLQNAEIAPARLFKKEPTTPIENYFITGMKMEAVNKQNPAIIGVATVVDLDDERIRIEFDSYKGSGYWCHYSDRDLFPAGWCSRSGHPLKPPGGNDKSFVVASQGSSSPSMISTSSDSRSNSGSPYIVYPSPIPLSSREAAWKDKTVQGNNVEIFINTDCYCGPYLDSRKVEQMQHVYRGSIVTVLKSVLEDTIRCAIDSKTVFGFLKPGRGNCVVTATCDGMTYQCCLNSIDRVSTFWRVLEQFSDNLRCCSNLFSSVDYRRCCDRCNRSKPTSKPPEQQAQLGKRSITPSGYSSNASRRTDSKSNSTELHKQTSRQDNLFDDSSCNIPGFDSSREESDVVQPRQDNLHQESLRQESLRQESLRQESLRQESLHQESLRQESLRQESLRQESLRQESLRQESLRQETLRQESTLRTECIRQDSVYETIRQKSFSGPNGKDEVIHSSVHMDTKYENDRESLSVEDMKPPPEKRKREETNEVAGIEILTAPKTWSIDQVISFIEQTDLKDNVDNFKDNEIDGKALLLLQRDLVLSHMGFKLGPAVKLLDLIEELRVVQEKFN